MARKRLAEGDTSTPITVTLPRRTAERIENLVRVRGNITRSELLRQWIVEKLIDTERDSR